AGDFALRLGSATGAACGLLLAANIAPRATLWLMWVLYVSLCTLAPEFTPTIVDRLLSEVLLLSAFYAPRGLRPGLGAEDPPHPLTVLAMRWLVLRLMFESGVTKLLGPDGGWLDLSIMKRVYPTAPYPLPLAYVAAHLPDVILGAQVLLTFAA